MAVMTESVMVTTRTAAQEMRPLLLKFINPAFVILLNTVIILIDYIN